MKRWAIAAVLVLAAAVGLLAAAAARLDATALPAELTAGCVWGDASAARGLRVHTASAFAGAARWDNDYAPAEGAGESAFHFNVAGARRPETGGVYTSNWLPVLHVSPDGADPALTQLLEQARENAVRGASGVISLTEHWRYRLQLEVSWIREPALPNEDEVTLDLRESGAWSAPLSLLELPVLPGDRLLVRELRATADDVYYSSARLLSSTGLTTCQIHYEDRILLGVGFGPEAAPEPDWAPEGFGLWEIPIRADSSAPSMAAPDVSAARLVYPLDIAGQRVLALQEAADGSVLLVTAEGGQFVLHVLEQGTCRLLQKLPLGEAFTERQEKALYLPDSGEEFTYTRVTYPEILLFPQEECTVIGLGQRRILVLTPGSGGWRKELDCAASWLYDAYGAGSWSVPEPDAAAEGALCPFTQEWGVEPVTLAYAGGRLALARCADYFGSGVLLEVYGPEGLLYGALLRSGVAGQVYSERYSMRYVPGALALAWE